MTSVFATSTPLENQQRQPRPLPNLPPNAPLKQRNNVAPPAPPPPALKFKSPSNYIQKQSFDCTVGSAINQAASLQVDDILQLPNIAASNVVELLRIRFMRGDYYTHLGRLVIALNPYRKSDHLFSETISRNYAKKQTNSMKRLPPHLFSIGNDAIESLKINEKDQIITISGESGSGKTESARLLIQFLVTRLGMFYFCFIQMLSVYLKLCIGKSTIRR